MDTRFILLCVVLSQTAVTVNSHGSIKALIDKVKRMDDELLDLKLDQHQMEEQFHNDIDFLKLSLRADLLNNMVPEYLEKQVKDYIVQTLRSQSLEDLLNSQTGAEVTQLKQELRHMKRKYHHVSNRLRTADAQRTEMKNSFMKRNDQLAARVGILEQVSKKAGKRLKHLELENYHLKTSLQMMNVSLSDELDSECGCGSGVDMELPARHCSAPVSITHANVSRGNQRIGTVRTYTCNQGYLDVTRDDVSFETTCLSDGSWSAVSLTCSGPYVRVEPPLQTDLEYVFQAIPSDTLQDLTRNTSSLIFLTKTCTDSNFALHRQPTFDAKLGDVYEVVIGGYGNTLSVINNCIQCVRKAEHSEADLLSCTEFRPFWFSWKNGIISVGKGRVVGDRMFLTWTPPSPFPINYVSVSSYRNNKGVWLFSPQA